MNKFPSNSMENPSKKNPNSSIRSGYKYEDLHVLRLCAEWLVEPQKFKQIRIQYTPDGINGFAMDDIVVEYETGRSSFYQLKYKQNPDTAFWDFDHLLAKGLLKWIASYAKLNASLVEECTLITNGKAGVDVNQCLSGDKISFNKICEKYPSLHDHLKVKVGNDQLLEEFFSAFNFVFNDSDKYSLETKLRKFLYEEVKVTKAGVDSLLLFIGDEGSEQYPKIITLNDIRKYLSWDKPRPLNQNFQIPADFEFFNQHTHDEVLSDLQKPTGGIKVFTGKPGAGKSTYLSKLYSVLKSKKISVFRHHYHLNPKDHTHFERLNSDRVKEALRADFKNEKSEVLGELSSINTEHVPLREFISKLATHYSEQGKAFVLIIDGLDHVIREGNSEEQLKIFLNDIMYPQLGYWLILGTQEMAIKSFPNAIHKISPEDTWIEIKGLNLDNVLRIVKRAFPKLNSKKDWSASRSTINQIYTITSGNPLHLRYVLGELKKYDRHFYTYELERIPAYRGDIKNYYEDLWQSLSPLGKTFCFAITVVDFRLHKEQLMELGGYLAAFPSEISTSYTEIKHLIAVGLSGISVYHNSFLVFILEQPELQEQRSLLYRCIKLWLNSTNDEDLKWSELAKIEYYLGNSTPLLTIDKHWIISSYLKCRDQNQIQNLLDLATEAAFKAKDYKKTIFFTEISNKFNGRSYNLWDVNLQKIWVTAFRSDPEISIKYPDFSQLTHYQLKELLLALREKGMIKQIPPEAMDRIRILFHDQNHDIEPLVKDWTEVLLNFDDISDKKILKFLQQFRKGKSSETYFSFYLEKLLENQKRFKTRIDSLFASKLTEDEKRSICRVLIYTDLKDGTAVWNDTIISIGPKTSNITKIYFFLTAGVVPDVVSLLPRTQYPDKYEYATGSNEGWNLYRNHLYNSLFLLLDNKGEVIKQWLDANNSDNLQSKLLNTIIETCGNIKNFYTQKRRLSILEILLPLQKVEEPSFHKDFKIYEIRRGIIPVVIEEIVWICDIFNTKLGYNSALEKEELQSVINHNWYYTTRLFDLIHEKRVRLSSNAFQFFAESEISNLAEELVEFKDKTERMVNLALVAAEQKKQESLNILLYHAAENIISYGHHKDMSLYDILLAIEKLTKIYPEKAGPILEKIAPFVYHIDKLTDGDETGSFIYNFSNSLARADPQTLYKFYKSTLVSREYYQSEALFGDILKTLDMTEPISAAIANTAASNASYDELLQIAKTDNDAKNILSNIQSSLGHVDFSDKPREETQASSHSNDLPDSALEAVTPVKLKSHLNSIKAKSSFGKHEMNNYLHKWAIYWLEQHSENVPETLNSLKDIITEDFVQFEYALLDDLYSYCREIDREFAFQCICWAHAINGSWSSDYYSRPVEAQTRWQKVIADFPLRIEEFFMTSVMNSGLRYGEKKYNYSFSAPKVVQFWIDADQIEKAEQIIWNYIEFLPTVFPNVNLPVPDFYAKNFSVSLFDILLSRLEWMSPIVKERAAKQLIQLLSGDKDDQYHEKFLVWLYNVDLENRACEGLIILLLALEDDNSYSRKYLNSINLGAILQIRCLATDLIIQAIGDKLNVKFKIIQDLDTSMSISFDDSKKHDFYELVGTNLPSIYLQNLASLQEKVPFPVWACWKGLYDDYCANAELTYNRDDERYCNDFHAGMIGRSTIFAEILRSTFLKVIDFLYVEQLLDYGDFYRYCIANFTIEPSAWSIQLASKPEWWPKLPHISIKENLDSIPEFEVPISKLITMSDTEQVLSMSGTIGQSDNFYHNDHFCETKITAFGYTNEPGSLPSAEEVYYLLESKSGFWYPETIKPSNFGVFTNELKFSAANAQLNTPNSSISPLVAPVRSFNSNMLQYYRMFYPAKLLTPSIKDDLVLEISNGRLQYLKDQKTYCTALDFLDGLRDSTDLREVLPYGNFTFIERSHLSNFLVKRNLKLGYVVKRTLLYKAPLTREDKFNSVSDYSLLHVKL